jgi:hypothetical protein
MQGRCTKLWFINIHYADDTIMHKDTRLDFTIENRSTGERTEAGNGLISLENGDGKGLILQLFTNLFDPMVDWKDGSNKMAHLFFNSKGKPIRYTAYIVGEFAVGEDKRLMLGLGITPRIIAKEQQREEKTDIVVDYIQFVREYTLKDQFDIYELPLFNETGDDAISFAEFKKMAERDYKDAIEVINVSNRSTYTQLLHSYGYTTAAISNMKQLNQKEGSVKAYFNNAFTNEGLFFNRIIPSINDELQNTDSTKETSDLITSFLDTVKIAKDLPELMEISESAEIVKEMLNPISDRLKQGLDIEEEKNRLKQKGYAIKEKMAEVSYLKKRESDRIQVQITNEKNTIFRLDYEIDNTDYSRTFGERNSIEKTLNELEVEIKENKENSSKLQEEKKAETINKHLERFGFYQSEIDKKLELKKELEESLEHKELVTKLKDLRKSIQSRWENHILPSWKRILASGKRYILENEQEISQLKEEESTLAEKKGAMNQLKKELKASIEKHQIKLDAVIVKKHGEKARFDLNGVIKQTENRINDSVNEQGIKKTELRNSEIRYLDALSTKKLLEDRKNNTEEELQLLNENIEKTTELEKTLIEPNISIYLKEDDGEQRTRSWFLGKRAKAQNKIKHYEEKLASTKRKLWDMENEVELLKESEDFDVWIPNKDVLSLKKKLNDQDISCMLGSELLSTKSLTERKKEILKNPLIPYSVILFQEECSKIDFSLLQKELYRSMVPILIRQEMKNDVVDGLLNDLLKISNSGFVVKGKGYELIEDEEAWEYWKLEIENSNTVLNEDIKGLSDLIEEGKWIVDTLNQHLAGKVSDELIVKKKRLNEVLSSIAADLEKNENEITSLETTIKSLREELDEITNAIQKDKDNLRDLLSWKDECEVNERNNSDLQELEAQLADLMKIIDDKKVKILLKTHIVDTFKNELVKWENNAQNCLRQIQLQVVGATYPSISEGEIREASAEKPSLNKVVDPQSEILLETYRELSAKEGSSNVRIELLNSEISSLTDRRDVHINWLNQNEKEWEGMAIPEDTSTEIEDKIELLERKIKLAEASIQDLNIQKASLSSDLKHCSVQLKMQRNIMLERYKKEPVYVSGLDYDVEKSNFKEQQKEAQNRLLELTQRLEDNMELLKNIELLTESLLLESYIEVSSFVLSEGDKNKAEENPLVLVDEWNKSRAKTEEELERFKRGLEKSYNELLIQIENKESISKFIREPFKSIVREIQNAQFKKAIASIESIIFWAEKEVEKRAESKKQCDEAIRFFTVRCTKRVQDVITNLKVFVNKMKVKNVDGDFVELVRFEKSYKFPDNKEDIHLQIKEYCENTIAALIKKHPNTEKIGIKDVESFVNISQLMKVVLGKFPKLHIYIPDGTGSLLTERPKEHLYKEWEVINNGGDRSSSKSGGQTIMAHLILISMLQKKANNDNWTMIVTDNLFGAMSAKKLVQPVFAVLEMLKVQWITVVPANAPVQITSNFNVVYLLSVDYKRGKGIVTYDMEYYERRYLQQLNVVEELRNQKNKEKLA